MDSYLGGAKSLQEQKYLMKAVIVSGKMLYKSIKMKLSILGYLTLL